MKRIKCIQMQMQPARMDKALCFPINIFILLKANFRDECLCVFRSRPWKVCLGPKSYLFEPLLHYCLFQYSQEACVFINPIRTTCCSPRGMLQCLSLLMGILQSVWHCGIDPYSFYGWHFFLSVTSSEYTKQSKRSSRGFSMNFLCARQSGPPEFQ